MKTIFRNTLLSTALLALACTAAAHAQAPKPMPSPPATATATLAGQSVTIKYNTPSMRGRKIMGGLVPYDQVWRTGANPATTLVTATNLKIGTLEVPAGTYTIYSLPAAPGTPWQLIINKQTGQWGTVYDKAQELGRVSFPTNAAPSLVENLTYTLKDLGGNRGSLNLSWEDKSATVAFSVK